MKDIHKTDSKLIRLENRVYKENKFCSIRQFVLNENGEVIPTKKGVTFRLGLLPEIIAGLQELLDELKENKR